MKQLSVASAYSSLRKKVQQTLILGQKEIEKAKVHTYWQTGKLISEHIEKHKSQGSHYGGQVVARLSKDLNLSDTLILRCVRFANTFKIPATSPESLKLTWSHYVELVKVPDAETRTELLKRAEKGEWTQKELAQKIQQEVRHNGDGASLPLTPHPGLLPQGEKVSKKVPTSKLLPKKGALYTYALIAPDSVHDKEDADRLWIDLGFQVHRQLPEDAKGFKAGQIIESVKSAPLSYANKDGVRALAAYGGGYKARRSDRTEKDLYTYRAFIERVVDGDTLLVKIDLGFESRIRHYLRLRGVNCPELSTPEGRKAKAFVERELSGVSFVVMRSYRAEKYGRYLADVFYGGSEAGGGGSDGAETYLNQRLLDEGLAERYDGE